MKKKRKKTKARKKNAVVRLLETASDINKAAIGFLIPGAGNLGALLKEQK